VLRGNHKMLDYSVSQGSFQNSVSQTKFFPTFAPSKSPTSYFILPTFPNATTFNFQLATFHSPPRGAALPLHGLRLVERGSAGGQVPECESVRVLRQQSGAVGGPGREGDYRYWQSRSQTRILSQNKARSKKYWGSDQNE